MKKGWYSNNNIGFRMQSLKDYTVGAIVITLKPQTDQK